MLPAICKSDPVCDSEGSRTAKRFCRLHFAAHAIGLWRLLLHGDVHSSRKADQFFKWFTFAHVRATT